MRTIYDYFTLILLAILVLFAVSCTKDPGEGQGRLSGEGAQLRLTVGLESMTRLSELTDPSQMASGIGGNGKDYNLQNIGLYIYYQSDYDRGDLSNPYIRNLECTVVNGSLVPANPVGTDADLIYIYDKMTVVAFYPFNADMSEPENFFNTKEDEEKYPVTRADYSEQYYIPYRAEVNTDPTIAFYTELWFYPKHTYKLEIVVVANDGNLLPDTDGLILLPDIDPVTNTDLSADNKREAWYDKYIDLPNGGGGSHVRQYIAYIWHKEEGDNDLKKGEVLMQSGKLTLIASQEVKVQEDRVYRYGYNMSTGEIFIPTSSYLIHDRPTLEGVDGMNGDAYQCCDIDLSVSGDWDPIYIYKGRYDGGGHKITGMTVTGDKAEAGLFSHIQGNTNLCNVNLIDPVINITSTADTCYVGALTARVNAPFSEEDRMRLLNALPPGLSEVVKQALIKDMLKDLLNSTSRVVACRVENPTITVVGNNPRVGTVFGSAGERDEEGTFKSIVRDTYSLDGTISVNAGNPAANNTAYIGGFGGINHGSIIRSYTTITDINALAQEQTTDPDGNPVIIEVDKFEGFTNKGFYFSAAEGAGITTSFSVLADSNDGVTLFSEGWPSGWVTYTGIWPILTTGWLGSDSSSFWYDTGTSAPNYPTLQWERR